MIRNILAKLFDDITYERENDDNKKKPGKQEY